MNAKQCLIAGLVILLFSFKLPQARAENSPPNWLSWLTVSGNFDAHFTKTQFDTNQNRNAVVGLWDVRVEIEPPSWTNTLILGPYLRFSGIAASKNPAYENALLATPGLGGEVYPFSWSGFNKGDKTSWLVKALGPLRLYGEYNFQDYWGKENTWRPDHQIQAGADYWLAVNPNDIHKIWWTEIWAGAWWQSANEFDAHYDAWITAQSLRGGVRYPDAGLLSWVSPYALVESSLTDHQNYYWENRLDVGGGVRIAPPLKFGSFLNHFAIYAEYVHKAAYYGASAPAWIPNYDWRIGITFSVGRWFSDPFQKD